MVTFHPTWRGRVLLLAAGILLTFNACTGPAPFLVPAGTDSSGGGATPGVITDFPRSATGEKTSEEIAQNNEVGDTPDARDFGGLPPPPEQTTMERRAVRSDTTQNRPLGGGIVAPDHAFPGKLLPPLIGSRSVCRWPGWGYFFHIEGQALLWDQETLQMEPLLPFAGPGTFLVINREDNKTIAEAPLKAVMKKVAAADVEPWETANVDGMVLRQGYFILDFMVPEGQPYPPSLRYLIVPDLTSPELKDFRFPPKMPEVKDEEGRIKLNTRHLGELPPAAEVPLCEGVTNLLKNFINNLELPPKP